MFAEHNGVRIYFELHGKGDPLVLHHGFTESLESWRTKGFVDALAADFQLILMDARGHGQSDKPLDPAAYGLHERVSDVVAVLDAAGVERAHYLGYSLGGWVGFGLARYAPERVRTLALGGAHPYQQSMEPYRRLLGQDIHGLLAALEQIGGFTSPPAFRERFFSNDIEALRASYQGDRPDISDVVPRMAMPCLLFVGSDDDLFPKIRRCAGDLPQATFVELDGLNHVQAGLQLGRIIPELKAFLGLAEARARRVHST